MKTMYENQQNHGDYIDSKEQNHSDIHSKLEELEKSNEVPVDQSNLFEQV